MNNKEFKTLGCFRLKPAIVSRGYLVSNGLSVEQKDIVVKDLIGYTTNKCFFNNLDHDINNGDFTSGLYITNLLFRKEEPNLDTETLLLIAEQMKHQEEVVPETLYSNRCPFWSLAWSYLFSQPNLPTKDLLMHIDWIIETLEKVKMNSDFLEYYRSKEFAKDALRSFVTVAKISPESLLLLSSHSSELVRFASSQNPSCPREGKITAALLRNNIE